MSELLAFPLAITCFRHQSCFDFCEMVEKHLVPLTPVEQAEVIEREIWLERVNIQLEGLLKKDNINDKMLRHMANHYLIRNRICNKRIKHLKARLRRALRSKKRGDKLEIMANVTLAQQTNQ